jgi:hypothetical protein
MKNLLTIALLFISSLSFSQKTSKDLTASTGKDTLISINKNDVDLLNKIMLYQDFYKSLYDINDEKINLYESKIKTLQGIVLYDSLVMKNLQDTVYVLEYDLSVAKENELRAFQEKGDASIRAYEWRQRTLLGIPISLAGGFLIATLFR